MNDNRIWVLGAPDPEMELIEKLLRECGERVEYATVWRDGVRRRVTPAEAYAPDVEIGAGLRGLRATAYMVECAPAVLVGSPFDGIDWTGAAVKIDHHRPGDPGYGRPPEEFFGASSIGQVLSVLRRHGPAFFDAGEWITCDGGEPRDVGGFIIGMPYADTVPQEVVLAAAADHCLAAAYRGECPGVDPDALMQWRAETRAAHLGRSVDELLADVERAREALRAAALVELSGPLACEYHGATYEPGCGACAHAVVHDLRGRDVPELPEAAAREGVAYLATVVERNGRTKVVLGGHTTPEMVREFMEHWAPAHGLVGIYGDPARGFAGAYFVEEVE